MNATVPQPIETRLPGADAGQRAGARRTLVACGVYWLAALGQWWSAQIGLADPTWAAWLIAWLTPGLFGFYLLVRSGCSLGGRDPALSLLQMSYAVAVMAAAYLINPPLRGMVLMLVALVLVFAAFTLQPQHARAIGWLAVAVLGSAMLGGAQLAPQVFDPTIESIHFVFAAVVLPVISLLAAELAAMRVGLKAQKAELQQALAQIRRLATRDDLTGLVNRRHMQELAAGEHRRAQRSGMGPCLCLVDLDHFKRVNDRHGHAVGDAVLRRFAGLALAALRDTDVLARWGGEEFLLLLPDTAPPEARQGIERLRRSVAAEPRWAELPQLRVSFSAGLTAWRLDEPLRDALARADRALYQAKAQGRDRVVQA